MSTTNNRKLNRLLGGRGRNRTEVDASAVLLNLIESGKISVAEAKEAAHAVKNCKDVIDLCDDGNDDEQQSDSKSDITAAATGAATITTEIKAEDEQTVCDYESPEQDESSQQILKPLYEKGDSVCAKWEGNNNWFPGTIQSYTINDFKCRYGESRTYQIKFDDGDEGDCEDYNVFHHRDYLINDERKEGTWKGVKTVRDKSSSDEWAKLVGWYVVNTADGKTLTFSKLVSAMQAYDKSIIKQKGSETKGYELNLPEDYPEVGVNAVTPMAETGGERESKRRKISVNGQHDSFWAENKAEVGITEEAFMDKSKGIFLLNSGVNSTKKRNQDFGVFVSKGIATPGFDYVPHDIIPQIATLPQDELRKQLSQSNEFCNWMEGITTEKRSSAARQVAMWLKRATVGSFVVMRHEYERCRFCPKWLKNESGEYIGPVYIIGVITKKIIPCSGEEKRLACEISDPCSNLCLVDWIRMGFKKDLSKATTSYISKVCQPTVNQICHAYDKVYQGGATALSVRRDLWQNANTFVLPDDQSQSLQKSCLITRTRLACLTGGKVNKHQYGNPLNVGTPVTYCGGAAIATKNGKVHHICIKEEMNCPYPSTHTEQFVVYRKAPSPEKSGKQQKDVQLLIQAHPNHPPIPIFWEPTDQIGSAVMYIGHWKIAQIEDLKDRAEKYLGYYRCAKLYFDFHHFDERWEKVIRLCHDKSHEQIKELDFRGIET